MKNQIVTLADLGATHMRCQCEDDCAEVIQLNECAIVEGDRVMSPECVEYKRERILEVNQILFEMLKGEPDLTSPRHLDLIQALHYSERVLANLTDIDEA